MTAARPTIAEAITGLRADLERCRALQPGGRNRKEPVIVVVDLLDLDVALDHLRGFARVTGFCRAPELTR